jgi:hypothetical protein
VSIWEDSRLLALKDVLTGTAEYQHRRILRWYSRTFATPLHDVEQLPLEYVLQHYYESFWEKAEPEELEEARVDALKTPEDRWEEQMRESGDFIGADQIEAAQNLLLQLQAKKDAAKNGSLSQGQKPQKGAPLPKRKRPSAEDPLWNPDLAMGGGPKPAPKPLKTLPALKLDLQDLDEPAFESAEDELSPLDRDSGVNLQPKPPRKLR